MSGLSEQALRDAMNQVEKLWNKPDVLIYSSQNISDIVALATANERERIIKLLEENYPWRLAGVIALIKKDNNA